MANTNLKNILFVQDSPACIRTIKIATALQTLNLNVHLVYRDETPNEIYGFGNDSFASLNRLPKRKANDISFIKTLLTEYNIELIHFHNFPDKLGAKIIQSDIEVPFIYDQHDFMSQKKAYSPMLLHFEKICNQENDGAIFITENYRKLVVKKYKVNKNNIIFGNFGVSKLIQEELKEYKDKPISKKKIEAVYIGLITEHKNKVRYMIDMFKKLSDSNITIHIYPTRNKDYKQYTAIPNVILHKQKLISELIIEMQKYDFGIAFLNHKIKDKKRAEEVKYGFWNKMNDYLIAGIPILTLDYYVDMSKFVKENKFGVSVGNIEEITSDYLLQVDTNEIRKNIFENREKWFMENQINRVYKFYLKTIKLFNTKRKTYK